MAAFFVFDVKTGLYSLLGLSIRSFMVDSFIESLNLHKYFTVVCDDPQPICDYITHELNRSATVCEAKGAFSGSNKYIIFTVMNRMEAVKLRNYIKICDYITHELNRSATVCEAKGAFSGSNKYIIFTVMNRMEAVKLRNYIKIQEPHAFILISNTSQIIGKGFHSV